jgi:hypothetical protein
MAVITHDLTAFPRSVREALRKSLGDANRAKLAIAKANQARLAKLYEGAGEAGAVGKIGPLDMVIDPHLVSYFSRTCEAREMVWDDPEFIEWLKKNEPATRVKHGTQRVQILT